MISSLNIVQVTHSDLSGATVTTDGRNPTNPDDAKCDATIRTSLGGGDGHPPVMAVDDYSESGTDKTAISPSPMADGGRGKMTETVSNC